MRSKLPFAVTVRKMLEVTGMSQAELSRRATARNPGGLGLSPSALTRFVKEHERLRPHHIEAFARALDVLPETFAEYRLWQARHLFDPAEPKDGGVGWDAAIENLEHFEELREREAAARVKGPAAPHDPLDIPGAVDPSADEEADAQP